MFDTVGNKLICYPDKKSKYPFVGLSIKMNLLWGELSWYKGWKQKAETFYLICLINIYMTQSLNTKSLWFYSSCMWVIRSWLGAVISWSLRWLRESLTLITPWLHRVSMSKQKLIQHIHGKNKVHKYFELVEWCPQKKFCLESFITICMLVKKLQMDWENKRCCLNGQWVTCWLASQFRPKHRVKICARYS